MIYIQARKINGYLMPHHVDCASAMYGAHISCQDFNLITWEDLQTGKWDIRIRGNLFVGSVEFMQDVFRRIGLNDVRLPLNSDRKSVIMTLAEARGWSETKEIFIKPVGIKLFTGLVLDGANYSVLDTVPQDTKVFVYDVFPAPLKSEWRAYVHNHELSDLTNYSGDIATFPDVYQLKFMICLNKNKGVLPKTYTIDIGIISNYTDVVVEYNDMWAIGNYGVPDDIYLKMLKSRYFEIVNN